MQCLAFASQLGRHYEEFKAQGAEVLVIGGGPVNRAETMAKNVRLPFPILADPERNVYAHYSLSQKMIVMQQSGLILVDKQGIIRHIQRFTNPQAWMRSKEISEVQ